MKMVNDGLTKEDFVVAFKEVIKLTTEIEKKLIQKIDGKLSKADTEIADAASSIKKLKQEFQRVVQETKDVNETTFANVKKRTIEAIDTLFMKMRLNDKFNEIVGKHEQMMMANDKEMKKEMEEMYAEHEAMMKKCKEKMPNTEKMMGEMLAKVPEQTPEQTRDKLESIQDEEQKLAISSIAHLEEKLKDLEKKAGMSRGSVGGFNYGALQLHIVDDESLTGTINGVNTVFTLNNPPSPATSLKLYRGGARQRITEDFTLSGSTITFLVAPQVGEILLADYRL